MHCRAIRFRAIRKIRLHAVYRTLAVIRFEIEQRDPREHVGH